MSGVAVIRFLLATSAPILAYPVPATRIYAGVIPLGTALPAIGITEVSGVERLTVSMLDPRRLRTERVQVTVLAGTYPAQKTLLALALAACGNRAATVNGVSVDSILPEGEGPDLSDEASGIREQSLDFIVRWRP